MFLAKKDIHVNYLLQNFGFQIPQQTWGLTNNGEIYCSTNEGVDCKHSGMPDTLRELFGSAESACGILTTGEIQCWGPPAVHAIGLESPTNLGDVRGITMGYLGELCVIDNVHSYLTCVNNASETCIGLWMKWHIFAFGAYLTDLIFSRFDYFQNGCM